MGQDISILTPTPQIWVISCASSDGCREMWALEYEVDELQHKFADSIGKMDLDNLDVDFIEDMMLKAKPLQTVLNDIRNRQIVSYKRQ